nr:hypothetical protein [Renibacterium salmoninarum]
MIEIVRLAPTARLPTAQLTVCPVTVQALPASTWPEPPVMLAGKTSRVVTPVAGRGPLFLTVSRYSIG